MNTCTYEKNKKQLNDDRTKGSMKMLLNNVIHLYHNHKLPL